MMGLIGRKVGMTQLFDESGELVPLTVIESGPCYVLQVKTLERDGYSAVQLGFDPVKSGRLTKPLLGHFEKAHVPPMRILQEVRVDRVETYNVGQQIGVGIFKKGDLVSITGKSKGRGFAGVVKRHGFRGGSKTHGQSDRWRAPGSIGASSFPSRVWKNLKMAGRMGGTTVTVKNLKVWDIDVEKHLLIVKGAVPGHRNGYLFVRK
ncbi:MAG: 50S ribosomal protein L3 [Candidatus Latescibacteria bacterium]|nr:50S ribosomal protein L3 [Candidatus Latescibacterota bacterium]